ncbi:RNA polymerase sigma-70 factor [Sphingobacterium sp. DR205]|uniref:RNA polymerase sigma-70 factor n=1 Tax=Sphingobacterium sp. DR205 TaxID=2713573 RepID=UPI0013E4D3E6|nr:RNA polymerase sigma-70 factor [Sphingobacterium sp. DR205]QIH35947.1 RNA polymerase sigma-70 factor [Sphingobacterium sp. DR205]
MLEEKILLRKISEGDSIAFKAIYDQYWRQLLIDANKVIQDKLVAEDIVQETFISIWDNRERVNEIHSLKAYLKSSIRHACVKHIQRHINRYNFVELLPELLDKVISEYNTLDKLYVVEIEQAISKSMESMSPKVREVFELSRYHGKNRREIASQLSVSPETVKKRIQKALEIIRKDLESLDSYQKSILIFAFLLLT